MSGVERRMPKREECPVCHSKRHSDPIEITVGFQQTYGSCDEPVDYPMTEKFAYCLDCGTMRHYDYD